MLARVEAIAARAGRPMRFKPETTALIITALEFYAREGFAERRLNYTVDVWDTAGSNLVEHLAATSNPTIGEAAYAAALVGRPNDMVTLRHMTRMIKQSR